MLPISYQSTVLPFVIFPATLSLLIFIGSHSECNSCVAFRLRPNPSLSVRVDLSNWSQYVPDFLCFAWHDAILICSVTNWLQCESVLSPPYKEYLGHKLPSIHRRYTALHCSVHFLNSTQIYFPKCRPKQSVQHCNSTNVKEHCMIVLKLFVFFSK